MSVRKLIALTLVLGLLLPAVAAAAPFHSTPFRDVVSAPCVAGAAYDPACDVDHDGDVDIFDVQKTAGHWNQNGVWMSDNDHNHLGQTWTGSNNPLRIQGTLGAPDYAALVLNNTSAHGLAINNVGLDGIYVGTTGAYGMVVNYAAWDGVLVNVAGSDGVDVGGTNYAGYFRGNINVLGNCTGCLLATFSVNTGDKPLAHGDIVSLAGLRESGVDSVPMLLEVQTAAGGDAVVGVVQGWAELITEREPRPTEIGLRLVPREGVAGPGQYVTIAYSGLAQVKASGPVAQGSKLAVGTDGGAARALRTVTVDGVELAENASVIGVALEDLEAGDGLIWALVNVR